MTYESPIFGYGIHTKEFKDRNWGDTGVCIGLFNTSAQLGFIWLIIYLVFVYKGIKRMGLGVPTIYVLLIFIVIECNEAYIEAPISYFFIINFLNYNYINLFPTKSQEISSRVKIQSGNSICQISN